MLMRLPPIRFPKPTSLEALFQLLKKNTDGEDCNVLRYCLAKLFGGDAVKEAFFVGVVLSQVYDCACSSSKWFPPDGALKNLGQNSNESISYTRLQVSSILSHLFLCTLDQKGCGFYINARGEDMRTMISFQPFFCVNGFDSPKNVNRDTNPFVAYTNSILRFLTTDFIKQTPAQQDELVTVSRHYLQDTVHWMKVDRTISRDSITISLDGCIGDKPGEEAEFNFANKVIGPGPSGTQEEILFGCSPEMCFAALLVDPMLDGEAIIIKGVRKTSKNRGYGKELECLPLSDEEKNYDPNKRVILCLDALDMHQFFDRRPTPGQLLRQQLDPKVIHREIDKLYVGFSNIPREMPIGTGKWGCGVFLGHPLLKSILQILAATTANRRLHFYVFGDEKLKNAMEWFLGVFDGKSVGEVCSQLRQGAILDALRAY